MISLYRPGTSPLHRCSVAVKLLGLLSLTLVVSLLPRCWPVLVGIGTLAAAGFFVAGFGLWELVRQVWLLRWLLVIMLIPQLIFLSWQDALVTTARVVVVILLAALLTLTTPMSHLLDVLERGLAPLRRVGVQPQRVALLCSLTIATVPVIASLAAQLRDALRARGRRASNPRILLPLLVLTLQHADQLGDALRARGLD